MGNKSDLIQNKYENKQQKSQFKYVKIKQNSNAQFVEELQSKNIDLENLMTSIENIEDIYKFESKIVGSGNFGIVRVAYLISNPKKKFAVKTITKHRVQKDLHLLSRELNILRHIDHPNLIRFYEAYQDEKYFHLVQEFCEGGELFDMIVEKGKIPEKDCIKLMKKVFSAIKYLHDKGIAHRDIKPENLMMSDRSKKAEVKVIDFGLSKCFKSRNYADSISLKTIVGTPLYIAPEILKGHYDQRCDIWSLGVVLYIMLTGNAPFEGENHMQMFKAILKAQLDFNSKEWKKISPQAKDICQKMLILNPEKRITMEQIINHSWISGDDESQQNLSVDHKVIDSLKSYMGANKFKKLFLNAFINQMSEKEVNYVMQQFSKFDPLFTGVINLNQLKKVFEFNGYAFTEEQLQSIIQRAHNDNELVINYSEFLRATLNTKIFENEKLMHAIFKHFDVDNQNFITAQNIHDILQREGRNVPTQEINQMMLFVTKNQSDRLDYLKFKQIIQEQKIIKIQKTLSLFDESYYFEGIQQKLNNSQSSDDSIPDEVESSENNQKKKNYQNQINKVSQSSQNEINLI